MSGRPTIALAMIVKDEAHVIRRCLDSVLPVIDRWAIVDTGSTDGTQDAIRAHLAHLPGDLVERPWEDFATNRNQSLDLARATGADYALVIDADDVLELADDAILPTANAPAYWCEIRVGTTRVARIQMPRLDLSWRYASVVHEHLVLPVPPGAPPVPVPGLAGWSMRTLRDGARWQDRRVALERDVAALEGALATAPGDARLAFYLGQTLNQLGRFEEALARYREAADGEGADEQRFHALLAAGRVEVLVGRAADAAITLRSAAALRPWRAEPIVELARLANADGRHRAALALLEQIAPAPPALQGGIWLDADAWGASRDAELAVALLGAGDAHGAVAAAKACLDDPDAPPDAVERAERCVAAVLGGRTMRVVASLDELRAA